MPSPPQSSTKAASLQKVGVPPRRLSSSSAPARWKRSSRPGSWDGYPGGDAPGFSFETLAWIQRTQLAALASDTWGCEVRPNETEPGINQPWHWITIPIMGMTMGEIFYVAELGEGLRRGRRLRVHVRRARDPDHRRGGLAHQPARDQMRFSVKKL
jgi:hypothetical protein